MPISVTCPDCGADYTLADRLAGKKVRCQKCEAIIPVRKDGDEEADAPPADAIRSEAPPREKEPARPPARASRPARRDEDDEETPPVKARRRARERDEDDEERPRIKKKESGLPLVLILGGAGVLVLLLLLCAGAGVAFYVLRASPGAPPPPVAVASSPKPPPAPEKDKAPAADPAKPPAAPPPAPPAANAGPLTPDPLPADLAPPDNLKGEIPITGFFNAVRFPTSPSPFVAISAKEGLNESREVWDLRTMKRVGAVSPKGFNNDLTLSPDGAFFAAHGMNGLKPTVTVWTVASGAETTINLDDKGGFLQDADFAGPGQVLSTKVSGFDLLVQIWDVKSGAEVRHFEANAGWDRKGRAFSGGRKYLAVVGRDNKILIYDLTAGAPVADLPFAAGAQCRGLAFSPDGRSLAGLFGMFGLGTTARLEIWDLTTGQPTLTHDFDKDPQQVAQSAMLYEGEAVEWLPDGDGVALYGQLLLDAKNAALFWHIPNDANDNSSRRFFPGGRVAYVKGDFQHKALVVEALPADQLAAARKAAAAGQDPATAAMPGLKPADWSAVKELPAAAGAVDWKAAADPVAPKAGLGARPIPLSGKAGDLVRILFSAPDSAQAAVLTASSTDPLGARKQVHVDRYDLAGGKALGGADLFLGEFPHDRPTALDADLSPDGTLLAVRQPKDGKRLDVWSLADGKQLAGWLPCEKEGDGAVRWFAFLDAKRLLTLGASQLTLWDVPECRAVYSASWVREAPALSPGRKYLLAYIGSSIEVLEAATGERVGEIVRPGLQGVRAAAYRPDGQELAALLTTTDGLVLARWDAKTGAAKGEFAVSAVNGPLEWCGPDAVLLDQTLFDLDLKWPIAMYSLPGFGRHAPGGPDGRHWFAYAKTQNDPPLLTAEALPDEAVHQLAKDLAGGKMQVLMAPGMNVNVQVNGAGPDANADAYRNNIATGLTQRLHSEGFKTDPGGSLTLAVQIQPARDTGKVERYEAIGPGGRRIIDVHIQQVDVQMTLTDAKAGVIWSQKATLQTPLPQVAFRVEDLQAELNKGLWNGVAGWAGSVGPPTGLIHGPAGNEPLPKPVMLK